MKILILDTIHGAGILADRYSEGNEVMCVDVYGTTPEEDLEKLRKKGYGVSRSVPPGNYDLVIMPGHCPDSFLEDVTYGRRIFFSEAVKEKIDDGRFRIEVTGVKGKTSSCYLMAHLLSAAGKKVYLHTSRGRGPWIDDKHRNKRKGEHCSDFSSDGSRRGLRCSDMRSVPGRFRKSGYRLHNQPSFRLRHSEEHQKSVGCQSGHFFRRY